jgi:hypothetical protein
MELLMKRKPRTPEQQESLADHFFEAINDGSDLVCAIVGAATVEWAALCLVKKYLIDSSVTEKMLNGTALGSLSGLSDFLYCTGRITKSIFQACITIGEIRNEFAHSDLPVSFGDKVIEEKCTSLRLAEEGPNKIVGFNIVIESNSRPKRSRKLHAVPARERFCSFASTIRNHLLHLAKEASPMAPPPTVLFVDSVHRSPAT